MPDVRESDASDIEEVDATSSSAKKKHRRIVIRINVLNHQELTREHRSCGWCIVCFLSKDSLEDKVNQIVGQQVHDDMKKAGLETTWIVEGKQIKVEIRDQNRYVQAVAKGIVENEVRKELAERGVEFELSVKREKVDKNKIPKRLVVRISISSTEEFKAPLPPANDKETDAKQHQESGSSNANNQGETTQVSSPISAIKRISTIRQTKKTQTKAEVYSVIENHLSSVLDALGHENLVISDPLNNSMRIIITNHAHWALQYFYQNIIHDKIEKELREMQVVSVVNLKRELVEELA